MNNATRLGWLVMAATLCLAALPARTEAELGVALKIGPNAATLAENHRDNRYGFSGGLAGYLQWPLDSRFAIAGQVELLYTPRGAKAVFEGAYLGQLRQHYFDAVLAARPEARFGPVSVHLLLGSGLSTLLSANQEDDAGMKVDVTDAVRRFDVALIVGAGIAARLPAQELGPLRLGTAFLEARHDRGFIGSDAVNGGYRNRSSSLLVGLSFALGAGPGKSLPAALSPTDPYPAAGAATAE